jgi:hypothetical protein
MPRLGNEVCLIAAVDANLAFKSPILFKLGPSIAGGFLHLATAKSGELCGVTIDGAIGRTRSEGELTARLAEQAGPIMAS